MYPSGSGAERFGLAGSAAGPAEALSAAALAAMRLRSSSASAAQVSAAGTGGLAGGTGGGSGGAFTTGGTGGADFLSAAGEPLRKGFSGIPGGGPVCCSFGGGAFGVVGGCGTEGCHGENLGVGVEEDDAVPPWPSNRPAMCAWTYPGEPGGGPVGGVGAGKLGGAALNPGGGVGGAFTPPYILCRSEGGGALNPTGAVITKEHAVSCNSSRQAHAAYAGT